MAATINLKLWKYRPTQDGSFRIYIRVTKNRKSSWQSTDISVMEKHWDGKRCKVKASHPNSARLNALLGQVQLKYQTDILEAENGSTGVSLRAIKRALKGEGEKNFMAAANELVKSYKIEGKVATYDKSVSILKKFCEYMHSADFEFHDLDIKLLMNYQTYLMEKLKNKPSSINRDMKFIKTVFNYAHRMEYIPLNVNPFLKYRFLKVSSDRGFLTPEEMRIIEECNCNNIPFLLKAKDIILFQYYAGGLRISDALLLRWEHVLDGRIYMKIKKTGKQTSHKVTEKGLKILEKYKPLATSFVFGYLKDQVDLNDPFEVDREISAKTALINKALKTIAQLCKLEKRLSTHLLRHSFATNALQQGMSLDVLQNILKHSNIRETQIYAKVLNYKVDAELDKLNL